MKKYLTLTNGASGQKFPIDLTQILGFEVSTASTTQMTIIFRPIIGNEDLRLRISHDAAPNAYAFQNWFVGEMERILAGNWREVEDAPAPPYAVTAIFIV